MSFYAQPAIKSHAEMKEANYPADRIRKLVTYARPHAERNAYELTVLAISEAVRAGVFGTEGEVRNNDRPTCCDVQHMRLYAAQLLAVAVPLSV